MINESALAVLRCPNTQLPLSLSGQQLQAQGFTYPLIKGTPWLFKQPDFMLREWGTKIQCYLEDERLQLKYLQHDLMATRSALTKQRLTLQHQARTKNLALMKKMLANFLTYPQLNIMPSTQQIYSYFQLFFRDWCWDESEIETYVDYSRQCMASVNPNSRILILGSGAGGLGYRLAKHYREHQFFCIEHNPFLALGAQHIIQGKSLKLHDVSQYAKSVEQSTQKWEIKIPPLETQNHHTFLASFPDLPFEAASFDVIIAPWFLDILEQPFGQALTQATSFLKPEGKFVFFGPANVHKAALHAQLSHEEITACFERLFSQVTASTSTLFYLDSPLNSQRRQEHIAWVSATALRSNQQRSAAQITDTEQHHDITLTPQWEQYQAKIGTYYNVMTRITHDMSYAELAVILEKEFGFSGDESLHYAQLFAKRIAQDLS